MRARRRIRPIAVLLLTAAMTASTGAARTSEPPAAAAGARESRAGLLCVWAIVNVAAEVGRRCRAGRNPALQAELERSIARFEDHVLRNSDATADRIATFRRDQGMSGADNAALCRGDPVMIYEAIAAGGPEALRRETDRLLARPGGPEWGDCF